MEKHPILLDTNAYLRIAKRVRPLLGVSFGTKRYELCILPDVEKEVVASRRLRHNYPWFGDDEHQDERLSKSLRLKPEERRSIEETKEFLLDFVSQNIDAIIEDGGSPPGSTDCYVLAVAIERGWILATDDEPLCRLAEEHDVTTLRCYEVVHKLHAAKKLSALEVVAIFQALERNGDLTKGWVDAKSTLFKKIFARFGTERE